VIAAHDFGFINIVLRGKGDFDIVEAEDMILKKYLKERQQICILNFKEISKETHDLYVEKHSHAR